jgi:outer membrane protein TolC
VLYRHQQIEATREAIRAAEQSYQRNLKRIRDGEGLPLEVLQSVQALETAHRAHLQAVVDYNQAQFRLQWAQGWPVQPPRAE